MKTVALILAGLALAPLPAAAQDTQATTLAPGVTRLDIAVHGKTTRVPDLAIINAGVQSRAATAREAIRDNAERMERVIAALEEAGVERRDIRTSNINLHPQYDHRRESATGPVLIGYDASNQVTVRFRDIATSGDILDALVEVGANQINGPQLTIEDPDEALDEARIDALKKGRERAELFAQALGKRVTRIVVVNEGTSIGRPPPPSMAMAESDSVVVTGARTSIIPGEQDVGVTLQMSFDLQ